MGTCQSSVIYEPFDSQRPLTFTLEREGASVGFLEARKDHLNLFQRNDALWFVPYLDRFIAGEQVTIEEIDAKHSELFGRPLDRGEFNGQSYQKCIKQ